MALPLSSIDKLIEKMDLQTVCKYSNELGEAKEEHQMEIEKAFFDGEQGNPYWDRLSYYKNTFKTK